MGDDDGERRPLLGQDSSTAEAGKESEFTNKQQYVKQPSWGKWRRGLIVCVLWLAQVIIISAYSLVAPFFPLEVGCSK